MTDAYASSIGDQVSLSVLLDNNGDDIQGWGFGACHDGSALTLNEVVDGSTALVMNNGSPLDFVGVWMDASQGYTVGAVVSFTGLASLESGTIGAELHVATYEVVDLSSTTTVEFCNSLGSPQVDTVVVVNGASIVPATQAGTVSVSPYLLRMTDAYASSIGDQVSLSALLDNNGGDIQGWSYGACHDGSVLSLNTVADGSTTLDVKNGSPPEFNQVNVGAGAGFTVGVVICFTGCAVLESGTVDAELNVASYTVIGSSAAPIMVDFCNTLGSPQVITNVVVNGASVTPTTLSGEIFLPQCSSIPEPPASLVCEQPVSEGCLCTVFLGWQVPALTPSAIEIYVNGALVEVLPGSTNSLALPLSTFGIANVCIRFLCNEGTVESSALVCCTVDCPIVEDCNQNGIPDSCDLESGFLDCNNNGVIDECEIDQGLVPDCNSNGIIDDCEYSSSVDCNLNGILDDCDVSLGVSDDCNGNAIPDECEEDCDGNGVADECDLFTNDCNSNGLVDTCEILSGSVADCNQNNVPDSCDFLNVPDCNSNGVLDECDIILGISLDCDSNLIPDECDLAGGAADVNGNEIPDVCESSPFVRGECNEDGAVDIGDCVFLLSFLFTSGVEPNCMDTADTNDDTSIDIGDAVYLLAFLFSFGPDLPEPFPSCGTDPSEDALDCDSYRGCP
ncbi:hypothetical protein OAU96_01610 [Planctomycetota bacterium]|nr:hypothetical protein [Planctomycetota bacterium]